MHGQAVGPLDTIELPKRPEAWFDDSGCDGVFVMTWNEL
jgi:hypothetical protein